MVASQAGDNMTVDRLLVGILVIAWLLRMGSVPAATLYFIYLWYQHRNVSVSRPVSW